MKEENVEIKKEDMIEQLKKSPKWLDFHIWWNDNYKDKINIWYDEEFEDNYDLRFNYWCDFPFEFQEGVFKKFIESNGNRISFTCDYIWSDYIWLNKGTMTERFFKTIEELINWYFNEQ